MKLLVVEDDQTTREYISKGFQEQGWNVDQTDNGREGLFLASGKPYDVIILDRMLPQMDGWFPTNLKPERFPSEKPLSQCCLTDWDSLPAHSTCSLSFTPTSHWINLFGRV